MNPSFVIVYQLLAVNDVSTIVYYMVVQLCHVIPLSRLAAAVCSCCSSSLVKQNQGRTPVVC